MPPKPQIRFGILLLPKGTRRAKLEGWFELGVARVRCLSWDAQTGAPWALLLARPRRAGQSMPIQDRMSQTSSAGVPVVDPCRE